MSLIRRLVLGDLDLTAYPYSVEFSEDWGSPQNTYDTLISMLADGEAVSSSRVSNRSVSIPVLVEGPTLGELAISESALIRECEKQRSTLLVDPGDDYAVPSVFDTFRVQATLQYDPDLEQANYRRYTLTIPAQPYARGEELVVTPAAETASETVLADGSSASGWSTDLDGTPPTVSAGTLVSPSADVAQIFTSTGSTEDLSAGGYLAVTWQASAPVSSFNVGIGIELDLPHATIATSGGWTTTYVKIPSGVTLARVFFVANFTNPATGTLTIDQVSIWTALPFIGTARQKALSLVPGGSVRTQGSIHVTHASSALGKTIVYTHPSGTGYLPPLRQWRTSGNTVTADSTLLSGSREPIGPSSTIFRVPVPVLPVGRVEIWAWLRVTTGSLTRAPAYAIRSIVNDVTLAASGGNFTTVFTALNTWQLFCLGALTSPPIGMGSAGFVQIDLNENSGAVEIDEAYLFATDEGGLTVVDCGTGTASSGGPSNHLWIDAPSVVLDSGAVYRGYAADRSDAFHAGSSAYSDTWGVHNFDPEGTSVFVATQGTTDAATSLEHYQRFHTHVADS